MRKKTLLCALTMMTFSTFITPMALAESVAVPTGVEDTADVEPRTDILEWRFKVIGDHLYKRLYNRSTGECETDWILVQ